MGGPGRGLQAPRYAPSMSEAELDRAIWRIVLDLAPWGLLGYHTRDSRRSAPGFPDWVFTGRRGVMFRESKTAKGKLSPEQQTWLAGLKTAGADMDVWRPDDLRQGRIARELADLAGPHNRPGGPHGRG